MTTAAFDFFIFPSMIHIFLQKLLLLVYGKLEVYVNGWVRTSSVIGSSDFDKIFENCFDSCSFGMAKDIQDYFRKGIFLNFFMFLSFFGFCVDKF